MSIPVALPALAASIEEYGPAAFFLTTADDGRSHISHVPVRWQGETLVVTLGRSGARNIAARPNTVLLWPPIEAGGYSLIVDVVAAVDGETAVLTPERAVLHRHAPATDPNAACEQDCRPIS